VEMQHELNRLYKEIIRLVSVHATFKDDEILSFKHNIKNMIINLGKVYYEENIRMALDCIDMRQESSIK